MGEKTRCAWCNMKNERYVDYHDNQWGRAVTDDKILYEMLILEMFQAGLSWETVLNKRENFRRRFDGFDREKVSRYGEEKTAALARDKGIIRNKRKIRAAVENSRIFLDIQKEYGSFYNYLVSFAGTEVIAECGPVSSPLSDAISKDLQKRGMKFVGTVIIYSFLQAVGIIFAHEPGCYLYKERFAL